MFEIVSTVTFVILLFTDKKVRSVYVERGLFTREDSESAGLHPTSSELSKDLVAPVDPDTYEAGPSGEVIPQPDENNTAARGAEQINHLIDNEAVPASAEQVNRWTETETSPNSPKQANHVTASEVLHKSAKRTKSRHDSPRSRSGILRGQRRQLIELASSHAQTKSSPRKRTEKPSQLSLIQHIKKDIEVTSPSQARRRRFSSAEAMGSDQETRMNRQVQQQ